jgi:hypothetical protein
LRVLEAETYSTSTSRFPQNPPCAFLITTDHAR